MSTGERISALRKSKGISQELLAENCHISLRTVQRIESGDSIPRPYTIKVIADALAVTIDQLIIEDESQSRELTRSRLINLSTLAVVILPLSNIILPLLIWRKNLGAPIVDEVARRVINFQIFWTIGTVVLLIVVQIFIARLGGNSVIGRYPPTILLTYWGAVVANFIFVLKAALTLKKGNVAVYEFVPALL